MAEEELDAGDLRPYHLATWETSEKGLVNEKKVNTVRNPMLDKWPGMNCLNPDEMVHGHILKNDSKRKMRRTELSSGCVRANVCAEIYWDPKDVKVGMVTAGGLCPGLNSIIRELTHCLHHKYKVTEIYGFQAGWNGAADMEKYAPMILTPESTRAIHMAGGSVLKAGRGGFDAPKICANLKAKGITMLFVIGGDGTQSAGNLLFEEAKRQKFQISIVGVPKSIDNDVLFFDRTFGFDSAVAAATDCIRNAYTEATSCDKGVGIVKLMGRDAGFVVQNAVIASTIVDLALIPEVSFELEDVFKHIEATIARKNYAVVVVAEGAGQELVATGEKDATGHTKYGDIGTFIRDKINARLKPQGGRSFYIDPSYIIRSIPIRPNDHIYCTRLACDAVHTAMRGYSGVCVGAIHNVISIVPSKFVASGKRRVSLTSSNWQLAVACANMPSTLSGLKSA